MIHSIKEYFWKICIASLVLNVYLCEGAKPDLKDEFNATAVMSLPEGKTRLKEVLMSVHVPPVDGIPINTSLFWGLTMEESMQGYAPVLCGIELQLQEGGWFAYVAYRICKKNKNCLMDTSHVIFPTSGYPVTFKTEMNSGGESYEYSAVGLDRNTSKIDEASELIYLINNRRVKGLMIGLYVPPDVDCESLVNTSFAISIDKLITDWDEPYCQSCTWTLKPDLSVPSPQLNRCLSLINPAMSSFTFPTLFTASLSISDILN